MSERDLTSGNHGGDHGDTEPGLADDPDESPRVAILGYVGGLALAALLTAASFGAVASGVIWGPGIPVALVALAIAQMGVHLVFFLHVTTGPDNTNNTLALAFGVLIIGLVLVGTLWIMANLSHTMVSMQALKGLQR